MKECGLHLIDTHDGKKVPLEQIAEIVSVSGPSSISRENVQRKIVISANVAGRDLRRVVEDIKTILNRILFYLKVIVLNMAGSLKVKRKHHKL